MTLRPREQDIRREKASSNICTNQGLMALSATVYLSLVGKKGLRNAAELSYHKAHYAAAQINALDGFSVDMSRAFFNEFIVKCPRDVRTINAALIEQGIIGGYHMLIACTELNRKAEIDNLVDVLRQFSSEGSPS
jgi:glycine dehydrogenase subunit 1